MMKFNKDVVKDPTAELIKAKSWFFVSSEGYSDTRYTENKWKFMMQKIQEKNPDYEFLFKKPDEILQEYDRVTSDTKVAESETPF